MTIIKKYKYPLGLAFIFVILSAIVHYGFLDVLDSRVDNWVRGTSRPALSSFFTLITHLGSVYFISFVTLLILWHIYRLKINDRLPYLLLCSSLGCFIVNYLLKNIVQRPRPPLPHLVAARGFSFPSGHAMVSMCFYAMVAFILSKTLQERLYIRLSMYLLATLIAASRVILHVHYLSDVIAGLFAGLGLFLYIASFDKTSVS